MFRFKTAFFSLLVCGACFQGYTSTTTELLKAQSQLDSRGEVYYCFYVNNLKEIGALSNIISLDRIDGNKTFAYANRQEFEAFLTYGFYYEILTPPGLAATGVVMSDYENVKFPLIDWTKYPTYAGYQSIMTELQTTYPTFVKLQDLGTSVNNKRIIMATVSKNVGTREHKPRFLWNAGIHGDELLAVMNTMRMIEWLCSNYGKDARATRILDSVELWMCPMYNPDGTYKGGVNTVTGAIRYNHNNVDLNRNFKRAFNLSGSPTPQKETQIFATFTQSRRFAMQIGWHAGTEMISYPWSTDGRKHADDLWYAYISKRFADKAQSLGPTGYFTKGGGDGYGQGYYDLYVAVGTEKDYLLFFDHIRANCIEVSMEKILPETKLDAHWGYLKDASLDYIQEILHGIRGTVTDTANGKGLKAKISITGYDKDSSEIYSDSSGGIGDYYRPIIAGTYNLTYSCPGCVSKTVSGIKPVNGRATVVNVQLNCGTSAIKNISSKLVNKITILPMSNGVKINATGLNGLKSAAIFDMTGRLVRMIPLQSRNGCILWDGKDNNARAVGAGSYIANIKSAEGTITKSFILTN